MGIFLSLTLKKNWNGDASISVHVACITTIIAEISFISDSYVPGSIAEFAASVDVSPRHTWCWLSRYIAEQIKLIVWPFVTVKTFKGSIDAGTGKKRNANIKMRNTARVSLMFFKKWSVSPVRYCSRVNHLYIRNQILVFWKKCGSEQTVKEKTNTR